MIPIYKEQLASISINGFVLDFCLTIKQKHMKKMAYP